MDAGTDCVKLFVLGSSMDAGGNQAGLIRRSHEGTLEEEEEESAGVAADYFRRARGHGGMVDSFSRLYGVPMLVDGVHFNKSMDSNIRHNKIWLDGCLCGTFQLLSRFYDADPHRREAVRAAPLTREMLRAKNAFSIELAIARRERRLVAALLSEADCASKQAWLISTLGPCRDRVWRQNTEGMYGRPMGIAYHPRANLLFYLDQDLGQLRVLKLSHTPCDNAPVSKNTSKLLSLREPTDLALLGNRVYITDADAKVPKLYMLDVSHVVASFNAAQEMYDDEGSSAGASATAKIKAVALSGVPVLQPYGIVADEEADALYMTDRQAKAVVRLTLGSATSTPVVLVSELPKKPAGVALVAGGEKLVVAAEDSLFVICIASKARTLVTQIDGADFCGVSIAPPALGGDLFAVDFGRNAVLRFAMLVHDGAGGAPSSSSSGVGATFAAEPACLVGGNLARPCSSGQFWYEGTASRVELWRPTFGCFARNAFVFMNSGAGKFGKVLLLNDLRPFAMRLLPAMLSAADAFGLTKDATCHAVHRTHAALLLEEFCDLQEEITEANAAPPYCASRGKQGEQGNFSNVVRRSSRQLCDQFLSQVHTAASLGAPQRCLNALTAKATTTMPVERSFSAHRTHHTNPYSKQFAETRTAAQELAIGRLGGKPFSVWTGERSGRLHYVGESGALAPRLYQLSKPDARSNPIKDRQGKLEILRRFAAQLPQAKAERVTNKAKERSATLPAFTYEKPVPPPTVREMAQDVRELASSASGPSARVAAPTEQMVELYRPGAVVYILGLRGRLEVAQLTEGLVQTTMASGEVRVSLQRVSCRYFVPTEEIMEWPSATQYWAAHRITSRADASARAEQSDGSHFSFFGKDKVTHSTIKGEFTSVTERATHHSKLVSFAVDGEELEAVCDELSGGAELPLEEQEEEAAGRHEPALEAERADAVDAGASARGGRLDARRLARQAHLERSEAEKEARRKSKRPVAQ